MHSQKPHPLLQPADLLDRHPRERRHGPAQQLFPGALAPEQFARGNAPGFVEQHADDLGVCVEMEGLGAVGAGRRGGVGVDGNAAAGRGG